MPTLLLRLAGPLQSWGTTSRFDERDSQLEPSKSGVLGLLCAALGRDRAEPIADLAALRMGVRVDREGVLMKDFQTATGVMTAAGKIDLDRTVVSPRYYLADASFLVVLEGTNRALLETLQAALRVPHWPLSLGRKSFPPGEPVFLKEGIQEESLQEVILKWPCLAVYNKAQRPPSLRTIIEHPLEGALRMDQPLAPFSERRFGARHVVSESIPFPAEVTRVPA